jgi:hypothetical protein
MFVEQWQLPILPECERFCASVSGTKEGKDIAVFCQDLDFV